MTIGTMAANDIISKFEEMKGKEVICSGWLEIRQERIDQFSDCTGDHQWIHTDTTRAALGPFGSTIAPGFLILSMVNLFREEGDFIPEGIKISVNYGLNKVRFITPVLTGSKIRDRVVLTGIEKKSENCILVTLTHKIEIEDQDKPACVAEVLSLFYF